MKRQTMWVDVARCTGCGACVDVCPVGAVTLVKGKAHVDEERCTDCSICVGVCPTGAIQPVVRGEIVSVPERPAPVIRQQQPTSPLTRTASAIAVTAGIELLTRAGRTLARAVERWLTRSLSDAAPTNTASPVSRSMSASQGRDTAGRGRRRARHRRRGG